MCLYILNLISNTSENGNNGSSNEGIVVSYKNKPLVIDTFAEPLERTYDEKDLLTPIYHVNPNWKPGDPEDYRYITSYINEGYTGFLPIQLKINPPNFVQLWGIEQSNGSVQWKSLPINEGGKYKYYYNSGQEGPYGLGFIPVKRYDQNTEDYDFIVNIPIEENIATLKITDGVLDSILTMEGGTLNLPSSLPALNTATEFNANGKEYATGVSIDLSELTYYPSMPMAQFNNGKGGNIINITENNSRSTFEELDGNRDTIEYITTPENPAPTPLMRSIVLQKGKSKTRDATTSNIVGYIDVNIPPPNITQTIRNNGYYNFNSDWNALVEGTEQNHKLDIQVTANTTTKTITIDSIGNNQSTTYNASTDNVDGFSSVTIVNNTLSAVPLEDKTIEYNLGLNIPNTITPSSGYYGINKVTFSPITSSNVCTNLFQNVTIEDVQSRINTELGLSNSLPTAVYNNKYFTINGNSVTNTMIYSVLSNGSQQVQAQGSLVAYLWSDIPFIANGFNFTYRGYCDIYVSNDTINWNKVITVPGHYTDVKTYNVEVPQLSASWKFYRFNFSGGWIYLNKLLSLFCSNSSYNIPNVNLENNKQITLTNNDINTTIYLNPSTGYDGFSNAIITVPDIHANPNLYTLPTIEDNGTYDLPSGYDGFAGPITVNITKQSSSSPLLYFIGSVDTEYGQVNTRITSKGIEVTPSPTTVTLRTAGAYSFDGTGFTVVQPGDTFHVDSGYHLILAKVVTDYATFYSFKTINGATTFHNGLSTLSVYYKSISTPSLRNYTSFCNLITYDDSSNKKQYFLYDMRSLPFVGSDNNQDNHSYLNDSNFISSFSRLI